MTEVLEVSRDDDTGEITQFLVMDDGMPSTKNATPTNLLLYDPADKLPFGGGLKQFVDGSEALRLSGDPSVILGQTGDQKSYVLAVDEHPVETLPSQSDEVLQGLYEALAHDDLSGLTDMHERIMEQQVRRDVVCPLATTFDERERILVVENGWLVDGFFLVDWSAKMYAANDDPEEGDFVRSSGKAVKKVRTYEFVQFERDVSNAVSSETVVIDGEEYELTEREMVFLTKVTWLLWREHYHPDEAFWDYTNKWADTPKEEPNLDKFEL
jgi:hypothetical protein